MKILKEKLAILGGSPLRDSFLLFGKPLIEEDEIKEVENTLRSGWLGTGPKVFKFQEMIKNYVGCQHSIALNSCTAGLHLSLLVAGVGSGDEVITSPMTFAATGNTIIHVGAKPVFVDVDISSMNIDIEQMESRITKRTKAIIVVHMSGRPCDMERVLFLAKKYKLTVINDAAHALGAEYKGKKIGCIGDLTCFSFYVTKNIVTGEGGMVTTDNKEWAKKIEMYALHGLSMGAWKRYSDEGFKHYTVVYPGYKYNMMDIQAALGIHQLPRIERYLKIREEICKKYDHAFSQLPVEIPSPPAEGTRHARHLYTLLLKTEELAVGRETIQQALHCENIGTGIHFIALHLHDYYQTTFGYKWGDYPNAEYISNRTISLPLSPGLKDSDVQDVINAVTKVLEYYRK